MGSRTRNCSGVVQASGLPITATKGRPEARTTREEGFTLAALIVILTVISIIVAFTVPPQWSMILHRERDKQTIFQMRQAARAIAIWQAKHQGLPTSLEQLKEAKKPRVIRVSGESFPMPLTGNEE